MPEVRLSLENFSTRLLTVGPEGMFAPPEGVPEERVLRVSDRAVWAALSGPGSPAAVRAACAAVADRVLLIESGEDHKDWAEASRILEAGFARGLARDGWIMGIGGGVVTDLAAFAASLFMRGCKLCLVPTTLLAQVDATLGGKTGINFGGHKNMVGSFYPADEIRVGVDLLATLPEREYLGGLAEVVKHAFLVGGELLGRVEGGRAAILARDPAVLPGLVWDSLMVKARVVEADLRERGERAHLNLGHTFAHGLEAAAGFGAWNHGMAVGWGMIRAARLSRRLGLAAGDWPERSEALLRAYGYPADAPGIDPRAIFEAMRSDKKKHGGQVRFVLQAAPGDTRMLAVPDAEVMAVLSGAD